MSELLGTAYVDIRPLTQGFEQQLKRQIQPSIDRATATLNARLGKQTAGGISAGVRAQVANLLADTTALREQAEASTAALGQTGVVAERNLAGAAVKATVLGFALQQVATGLQEVSDKGSVGAKIGGFFSNLFSLNFVGAIKAAGDEAQITDKFIRGIAEDTNNVDSTKLDGLAAALRDIGQSKAAAQLREIRNTLITTQALEFAQRTQNVANVGPGLASSRAIPGAIGAVLVNRGVTPDDRDGPRGPGALIIETFNRVDTAVREHVVGLTQRLQTAIAGARAFGTVDEQLAQLRRAGAQLEKQLAQPDLTDAERQRIFEGVTSLRAEIDGLMKSSADGIENAANAVAQARQRVRETVEAGKQRVSEALSQAQSNLTSLGDELVTEIGSLIDAGPLGQRIAQLQQRLGQSQFADQRRQLRGSLQDAKKELADAEGSVKILGPTGAQQAGIDEFLKPFREKVKDAQAALGEFNTQGVLDGLEATAQKQKETVERGINDLIARFKAGGITLGQLNAGIGDQLAAVGITNYRKAGDRLGFAFRQAFLQNLQDLKKQAAEILNTPAGTKPSSNIVSPAQVAQQAAADVQTARDQLAVAVKDLNEKQLTQLERIEANTRPKGAPAPTPKTPGANSGVTTVVGGANSSGRVRR